MRTTRFRLDTDSIYDELRRQVLDRDGWKCQFCGARENLDIHHLTFRSHSGPNEEENLITLCRQCHAHLHSGTRPRSK